MTYLIVDDEPLALKNLEWELKNIAPDAQIHPFTSPEAALEWATQNDVDIALLDINMRQMDGLTLAKSINLHCPYCAIIFITSYDMYAVEAFKLHANGYIMKPIDSDELKKEIDYVVEQFDLRNKWKIRVQCFGNFEVFLNGKIMNFTRKRSKELLAYLVDRRGAGASMAEIAAVLWEDGIYDKSRNKQIHVFLHDLEQTFAAANTRSLLIRQHNTIAVDCDRFQCDYYDYLAGDERAIASYNGEYMTQYSWAEVTNGSLQMI